MQDESSTKLCKKCDQYMPITSFKYGYTHCYECQKKMSREWKARNKERTLTYTQTWKTDNREHVSAYNAAYDAKNRETINKRVTAYHVARAKVDPNFKLAKTLRNRYRMVLKEGRLDESSLTLLGCSIDNFKEWLSFRFEDDMTFENHGSVWDLDHIESLMRKNPLKNARVAELPRCFRNDALAAGKPSRYGKNARGWTISSQAS